MPANGFLLLVFSFFFGVSSDDEADEGEELKLHDDELLEASVERESSQSLDSFLSTSVTPIMTNMSLL